MTLPGYPIDRFIRQIIRSGLLGLLWVLLVPGATQAQDGPRYEVFLGYSYLNAKPANTIDRLSMHGAHLEVFYPISRRLGPVLDISAHIGTTDIPQSTFGASEVNISQYAITTGVRFNGLQWKRLRGTMRALVGISMGDVSSDLAREFWIEETVFAAALGGGVILDLSDWVALRIVQPNLFLTTFGDDTQISTRVSTGLVLKIHP